VITLSFSLGLFCAIIAFMKETYYIINSSLVARRSEPYETGGHGYGPFSEKSITFVGGQEPSPNTVKITTANLDLREEILEAYNRLLKVSRPQDI